MLLFELKESVEIILKRLGEGKNILEEGHYKNIVSYMLSSEFGEYPIMDYVLELVKIAGDQKALNKYNRLSKKYDPNCDFEEPYQCIGKAQFNKIEDLLDDIIDELISEGICPNCGSTDLSLLKEYYHDSGYEVIGTVCRNCLTNIEDGDVYPQVTFAPEKKLRQSV